MADTDTEIPTVADYLEAAQNLARLVRQAFDNPHSVPRDVLLKALERYEHTDWRAM